ncbi:MAG: serine/threonine-protein kinase [Planctomycetota bacterium]|jgi:serine/threonine-protein kinase
MPDEATPLEEFPTPRDRAFGDIVVDMGLASPEAVEEALGLQVRYAFSGNDVPSLPQILVGRGFITSGQADRALRKLSEVAEEVEVELAPDPSFSNTSKKLPAMDDLASLDDGPRIIMPASALKEPSGITEAVGGPAEGEGSPEAAEAPPGPWIIAAGASAEEEVSEEPAAEDAAEEDAAEEEAPEEPAAEDAAEEEAPEEPAAEDTAEEEAPEEPAAEDAAEEETPEEPAAEDAAEEGAPEEPAAEDAAEEETPEEPAAEAPADEDEVPAESPETGEDAAPEGPPEEEAVAAPPEETARSTQLPSVPAIEHAPEGPLETGTVEIIMPVVKQSGGESPDTAKPAVRKPRSAGPPHPVPATKSSSAEPIHGYKLLARLSADETGTIFKAKQVAMDRLVALKVLPPKMTADRSFVDNFLREARDAGQLNHPNLVRVHEIGRTGNYFFYSMELVQGQTLEQNIKLGGRMPAARALQVTMEVVKAIEHMSSKSLLHGEISPEAVTVTNEGAVKVLLAGLGRSRADNTRFLVGDRYHYVAPERALADAFDVRADLYSAGAVLFYSLTGQHPYTGSNANQVLDQHFSAPVPNPKEIVTELAADVAKVVTKAMAKNRTERFGSPAEMIQAIEKAINATKPRRTGRSTRAGTRHTTTGTRAVRLRRRRRRRRR